MSTVRSSALALTVSATLLAAAIFAPAAIAAPEAAKADALKLKILHKEKPAGTSTLRTLAGKEGLYYAIEADLEGKVGKTVRTFAQRAHLALNLQGEVVKFDRWVDVTGATTQAKLFQYEGAWKVALPTDGPKPRVVPVQVKQPFVVVDERLPALALVAVERMAGLAEFDYVRLDDATFGRMTQTTETVVDKNGEEFTRVRLQGGNVTIDVVREAKGKTTLGVIGLGGWNAVVEGRKLPVGLKSLPSAVPPPADATPVDADAR